MAYSPFFKLPFAVGGAGLGSIPAADMRPMFAPAPEVDALAHWDLGGGSASLADLLTGRAMTVANAAPAYDALGVKLANGGLNALLTDINDKASNFAMACVAQLPAENGVGSGNATVLFGTMQASSGDGKGGLTYASAGSTVQTMVFNVRDAAGNPQVINNTAAAGAITPATTWLFVLASMAADGTRFIYVPGVGVLTGEAAVKAVSTRKVALGNAYYNTPSWMNGAKFSEFIVWDRALSQAEAQAVAQRTKDRMAYKKGIALLGL